MKHEEISRMKQEICNTCGAKETMPNLCKECKTIIKWKCKNGK